MSRLIKIINYFDLPLDADSFTSLDPNGATAARPATPETGQYFFDTTLVLPIWWSGTAWINGAGTPV